MDVAGFIKELVALFKHFTAERIKARKKRKPNQ
jgi:hypothetical protein